ncbi:MAG TPA: protein kinase [Ktedonobacteraceae bacterium]
MTPTSGETPLPHTSGSFNAKNFQSGSFPVDPFPSQPSTRGNERTAQRSEPFTPMPFVRGNEQVTQKNAPPRPQSPLQSGQRRNTTSDSQPGLRVKRLVTGADKGEMQTKSISRPGIAAGEEAKVPSSGAPISQDEPPFQVRSLLPGITLRSGRYQLRELLNRQEWQDGAYEATWSALDAQRGGSQVIITEFVIPDSSSMVVQSLLRTATMALTSVGRHAHIPTLWDAFGEQDRNFFVFEPIEGESLSARMRRTGRALSEQEVVEFGFQMADVLEILSQQMPPLVHGLIRPEHIIVSRTDNQYTLTNFSILLAGGATQFAAGLDPMQFSPYMAPEFARGTIDTRTDLYSLIATAYHIATGSVPVISGAMGTIPSAQRLNPTISSQLDQVLTKGLRPIIGQRYQRAAELKYDLLGMRSASANAATTSATSVPSANEMSFSHLAQITATQSPPIDTVAQMLPNLLSSQLVTGEQERKLLLPRPEDLPPMSAGNDAQQSILWFASILVCLVVLVVLSRMLA